MITRGRKTDKEEASRTRSLSRKQETITNNGNSNVTLRSRMRNKKEHEKENVKADKSAGKKNNNNVLQSSKTRSKSGNTQSSDKSFTDHVTLRSRKPIRGRGKDTMLKQQNKTVTEEDKCNRKERNNSAATEKLKDKSSNNSTLESSQKSENVQSKSLRLRSKSISKMKVNENLILDSSKTSRHDDGDHEVSANIVEVSDATIRDTMVANNNPTNSIRELSTSFKTRALRSRSKSLAERKFNESQYLSILKSFHAADDTDNRSVEDVPNETLPDTVDTTKKEETTTMKSPANRIFRSRSKSFAESLLQKPVEEKEQEEKIVKPKRGRPFKTVPDKITVQKPKKASNTKADVSELKENSKNKGKSPKQEKKRGRPVGALNKKKERKVEDDYTKFNLRDEHVIDVLEKRVFAIPDKIPIYRKDVSESKKVEDEKEDDIYDFLSLSQSNGSNKKPKSKSKPKLKSKAVKKEKPKSKKQWENVSRTQLNKIKVPFVKSFHKTTPKIQLQPVSFPEHHFEDAPPSPVPSDHDEQEKEVNITVPETNYFNPEGASSPWRINDDSVQLPTLKYFSRSKDLLPSYSSDVIAKSDISKERMLDNIRKSTENLRASIKKRKELLAKLEEKRKNLEQIHNPKSLTPEIEGIAENLNEIDGNSTKTIQDSIPEMESFMNDSNSENIVPENQDNISIQFSEVILGDRNKNRNRSPLKMLNIKNIENNSPLKSPLVTNSVTIRSHRKELDDGQKSRSYKLSLTKEKKKEDTIIEIEDSCEGKTMFGFEEIEEDEEEEQENIQNLNNVSKINKTTLKEKFDSVKKLIPVPKLITANKPTRVDLTTAKNIFKSPAKKQNNSRIMLASKVAPSSSTPYMQKGQFTRLNTNLDETEISIIESQGNSNQPLQNLFEDPAPPPATEDKEIFEKKNDNPRRSYTRVPLKNNKRKRNIYLHDLGLSDDDVEENEEAEVTEEEAVKKKRRVATKPAKKSVEQTQEYKTFVQEFNSMCDEVDKYQLVIEKK